MHYFALSFESMHFQAGQGKLYASQNRTSKSHFKIGSVNGPLCENACNIETHINVMQHRDSAIIPHRDNVVMLHRDKVIIPHRDNVVMLHRDKVIMLHRDKVIMPKLNPNLFLLMKRLKFRPVRYDLGQALPP
jgi:hypothetical protein